MATLTSSIGALAFAGLSQQYMALLEEKTAYGRAGCKEKAEEIWHKMLDKYQFDRFMDKAMALAYNEAKSAALLTPAFSVKQATKKRIEKKVANFVAAEKAKQSKTTATFFERVYTFKFNDFSYDIPNTGLNSPMADKLREESWNAYIKLHHDFSNK